MLSDREIDVKRPLKSFDVKVLKPRHVDSRVNGLVSPAPDLVVSVDQDGAMLMSNVRTNECLYQLGGGRYQLGEHKVWINNVWTDGRRLVSVGSDNTIVVHDVGGAPTQNGPWFS